MLISHTKCLITLTPITQFIMYVQLSTTTTKKLQCSKIGKKLCEEMKQVSDSVMTDYRSIRQGIQNKYD